MEAQTKNLLHWSSEISLDGQKRNKKKIYQSIEFSFKIAKSKLQKKKKIKTILVLMKTHNITTVVDKFVIDAKSKVCLRH